MRVRAARVDDAADLVRMRRALWREGTESEHRDEIDRFFQGSDPRRPWAVLVAESAEGDLVGFAEVSIRPCAEGCRSNRVAYLEGWFVRPASRKRGVGRELVAAAGKWGRSQGCPELASDAYADNEVSAAAHRAVGFDDLALVRCFRMDL